VQLQGGQQPLIGGVALGEAAGDHGVVVSARPALERANLGLERVMCQGEESQVATQRGVAGDRAEHRGDVLADAPLGVTESWRAPIEPGLQPAVAEQLSLERGLWGDRNGHMNSMAADGRGHWDIPMQ